MSWGDPSGHQRSQGVGREIAVRVAEASRRMRSLIVRSFGGPVMRSRRSLSFGNTLGLDELWLASLFTMLKESSSRVVERCQTGSQFGVSRYLGCPASERLAPRVYRVLGHLPSKGDAMCGLECSGSTFDILMTHRVPDKLPLSNLR
jgi:hypothetical protein